MKVKRTPVGVRVSCDECFYINERGSAFHRPGGMFATMREANRWIVSHEHTELRTKDDAMRAQAAAARAWHSTHG